MAHSYSLEQECSLWPPEYFDYHSP